MAHFIRKNLQGTGHTSSG